MLAYKYTLTNTFISESLEINGALDSPYPCVTIDGKPTGVRLTTYPKFEVEVRNEDINKMGQHGIYDFYSFYGKRSMVFEGEIFAESHSQLVRIQDRIKRIFTLPSQPIEGVNDGYINIKWTDSLGTEYQVNAKVENDIQFSRTIDEKTSCSFYIGLKADSPYFLSVEDRIQAGVMGWRQGMFILPAFLPNNFRVKYNNLINVYQKGSADAPGSFKLYGPSVNPKITRLQEVYSNEFLISDFTLGWIGGEEDRENFQLGGLARKLVSTNNVQEIMTYSQSMNLQDREFITCYFYIDNVANMATDGNYIMFREDTGKEFIANLSLGNLTIRDGWNYFIMQKDRFDIIGTPSWQDITEVEIGVKSLPTKTVSITFDVLKERDIVFQESFLKINYSLSSGEYVEFNTRQGTIKKNGIIDLSGYLSLDSNWFQLLPKQNLLIYESESNPLLTYEFPTQPVEIKWNDAVI